MRDSEPPSLLGHSVSGPCPCPCQALAALALALARAPLSHIEAGRLGTAPLSLGKAHGWGPVPCRFVRGNRGTAPPHTRTQAPSWIAQRAVVRPLAVAGDSDGVGAAEAKVPAPAPAPVPAGAVDIAASASWGQCAVIY
jgi:hypothetical protein